MMKTIDRKQQHDIIGHDGGFGAQTNGNGHTNIYLFGNNMMCGAHCEALEFVRKTVNIIYYSSEDEWRGELLERTNWTFS